MSEKKDITQLTFICQTFGLGGAETVNTDLLLAAIHLEHIQVHAYTTYKPFAVELKKVAISTTILPIEIDIIGDWKGLLKAAILWPWAVLQYLWIVWCSRHTDLILMSGFFEKIVVTPIAKLLGVPVVWIEFAPMNQLLEKFAGLPGILYRAVLQLPQQIIVPTPHTQRYFLKYFAYAQDRLIVLPCARYNLKPELYQNTAVNEEPTVVCVSRMEPGKGQDILVEAFAQVVKKFPLAKLLFVGEGGFTQLVKQKVSERKLDKNIQFLGRVKDALAVMATGTVCVFPSVWQLEGFGMVTIEAMALAKPIVAFNIGPSPEILEDGVTGLLARPGDSCDLAAKIIMLLEDQKLRQKLGKRAQQIYKKRYAFESIIKAYIQVFRQASQTDHA